MSLQCIFNYDKKGGLTKETVAVVLTLIVLNLCLSSIFSFPLSHPIDGTSCEWNVWDDTLEVKGVQKIPIRCSEGRLTWRTPYGGLSITFLPPIDLNGDEGYDVCFLIDATFVAIRLSQETFNESLKFLMVINASRSRLHRELCLFSTYKQPIVLYIESDSGLSSLVFGKLILDYDVRQRNIKRLSAEESDQDDIECRPCNEDQILLSVCTADYAVVGSIHSIDDDDDDDDNTSNYDFGREMKIRLNVVVSQIIRQRLRIVRDFLELSPKENNFFQNDMRYRNIDRNVTINNNKNRSSNYKNKTDDDEDRNRQFLLTILVPRKCHVKEGIGSFLFLGSIRLKKAELECAPRMEEFEKMWHHALESERNPCTL